jgi:hypothetical protein
MPIAFKRATKTFELCTDMTVQAEWEQAQRDLQAAVAASDGRQSVTRSQLARQVKELEELMASATIVFTFQALARKAFAEILDRHPVREDEDADKHFGVNVDTILPDLLAASFVSAAWKGSGDDVVEMSVTNYRDMVDELTDGQYSELLLTLVKLNRGSVAVPFSRAASRETRSLGKTSA